MDIFNALLVIFTPFNFMWFMLGCVIGIIAGILPGIGASLTMALLIPVTFFLPKETGLITLVSAWAAAVYGGSISSILINTPGTGANVATVLDGFPMARAGKAKVALAISATASLIGGLFGIVCLILFAPPLASLAMQFGPSEYFLLTIFGLVVISVTLKGSTIRGLIASGLGLMVSFMGYDVITGELRYTFGWDYLTDGIRFLVVVIGLFAVAQVIEFLSESGGSVSVIREIKGSFKEGILVTLRNWRLMLKSAVIGTVFGFAPGIGTSAAAVVAYGEAERSSSCPENFGKGCAEGIIAPETANNAVQGGALIPTLTLGIPGNSDSAVFMAGLMMYGINPGKDLFVNNSGLVTILFVALVLSQFAFWIVGLSLTNLFAKITLVPLNLLVPLIWLFSATGAFALHNNPVDVLVAIGIGLIAYFMRLTRFPIIPLLMAIILGPIAEKNFMRAMMISDGSYLTFFKGYINWIIIALIVAAIAVPPILRKLKPACEDLG
jgi:putative tricarboxylic transport membrane protein